MKEQTETLDQPAEQPVKANVAQAAAPYPDARTSTSIAPQAGCATCGGAGAEGVDSNGTGRISYIYAIGRVEARFPNLALEKEFAQAKGMASAAKNDRPLGHRTFDPDTGHRDVEGYFDDEDLEC